MQDELGNAGLRLPSVSALLHMEQTEQSMGQGQTLLHQMHSITLPTKSAVSFGCLHLTTD